VEVERGIGSIMPHVQSETIEVRQVPRKGRGVFARARIRRGTVIERVPVIVVPMREILADSGRSVVLDYAFEWGDDTVAIALGYGSIYNHSYRPNAKVISERLTLVFIAIRNINAGSEITTNYNGAPRSRSSVGFRVH
jgi:SET domain-containing protein